MCVYIDIWTNHPKGFLGGLAASVYHVLAKTFASKMQFQSNLLPYCWFNWNVTKDKSCSKIDQLYHLPVAWVSLLLWCALCLSRRPGFPPGALKVWLKHRACLVIGTNTSHYKSLTINIAWPCGPFFHRGIQVSLRGKPDGSEPWPTTNKSQGQVQKVPLWAIKGLLRVAVNLHFPTQSRTHSCKQEPDISQTVVPSTFTFNFPRSDFPSHSPF